MGSGLGKSLGSGKGLAMYLGSVKDSGSAKYPGSVKGLGSAKYPGSAKGWGLAMDLFPSL
jgi:hypothetical protein